MATTKVIFLIDKPADIFTGKGETETLGVFAFFPEDDYNHSGSLKWSYTQVGQHSECSPDYAKECKEATSELYADLKNELETSMGYELEVLNKA